MSSTPPPPVNHLDEIISLLGQSLVELRIAKGYSSYENFAYEHGLSRMQYYQMEKGTNCTLKSLVRVLNAHELDIFMFFSMIDPKNNRDEN